MSTPDQQPDKRRADPFGLTRLIDELKRLYQLIFQRIWQGNLANRQPGKQEESADIHNALAEHIAEKAGEYSAEEAKQADKDSAASKPTSSKSQPAAPGIGLFKTLARYFSRRHRTIVAQPHLAAEMQTKTTEHINRALQLARSGRADTAKLHIELAEQAMRTASQYMPEAEYEQFKAQVEERLGEIRRL